MVQKRKRSNDQPDILSKSSKLDSDLDSNIDTDSLILLMTDISIHGKNNSSDTMDTETSIIDTESLPFIPPPRKPRRLPPHWLQKKGPETDKDEEDEEHEEESDEEDEGTEYSSDIDSLFGYIDDIEKGMEYEGTEYTDMEDTDMEDTDMEDTDMEDTRDTESVKSRKLSKYYITTSDEKEEPIADTESITEQFVKMELNN